MVKAEGRVCWSLVTLWGQIWVKSPPRQSQHWYRVYFNTHPLSNPSIKYINSLGRVASNVYLLLCRHTYAHSLSKRTIKCWPCIQYTSTGACREPFQHMQEVEMCSSFLSKFHKTSFSHGDLARHKRWKEEVEMFAFHVKRTELSNYGLLTQFWWGNN